MANSDRPCGARPHGRVRQAIRLVASEVIYPGDFVVMDTDGKLDQAATGDTDILGVALEYAAADGDSVLVSIDPEQVYVVQADGTEIDAQTDVGQTYDIVAAAGDATYKQSNMELDSSTGGASQQLVLLGIDEREDNALGEFADCLVKINRLQIFGENDSAGV